MCDDGALHWQYGSERTVVFLVYGQVPAVRGAGPVASFRAGSGGRGVGALSDGVGPRGEAGLPGAVVPVEPVQADVAVRAAAWGPVAAAG